MKRRILVAPTVVIPLILLTATYWATKQRPVIVGRHRNARILQISPDGTRLFSRVQDVRVWDTDARVIRGQWKMSGARMIPDSEGARVVTASSPMKAEPREPTAMTALSGAVRDARTGAVICKFGDRWRHPRDLQDGLQDIAWSKDDREILTLTNGAVRRFDARDGHLIGRVFYDARNGYTSWQLAPDAREIVATDRKGAHFFSALTGKETRFWKHPAAATRNAPIAVRAIVPGGQWMAMEQWNGPNNSTIFWVRAAEGHLAWSKPRITTSTYGFEICGFSSNGELVLSREDDRVVARRCANGEEAWHLGAGFVQNAALSPDARFVYTVDVQGVIRRWKAPDSAKR